MNANLYLLMKPTCLHMYVHKVIIPDLTVLENVHDNQHERDQKNFAHSIIALASHKQAPEYAYVRTCAGTYVSGACIRASLQMDHPQVITFELHNLYTT